MKGLHCLRVNQVKNFFSKSTVAGKFYTLEQKGALQHILRDKLWVPHLQFSFQQEHGKYSLPCMH